MSNRIFAVNFGPDYAGKYVTRQHYGPSPIAESHAAVTEISDGVYYCDDDLSEDARGVVFWRLADDDVSTAYLFSTESYNVIPNLGDLGTAHGGGPWGAGGGGAYRVRLHAEDDVTLGPIQSVPITVRDAGDAIIGFGWTNSLGQVDFYLDAGTYTFAANTMARYAPVTPYTIPIAADAEYTFSYTALPSPLPIEANQCIVTARVVDSAGAPKVGTSFAFKLVLSGLTELADNQAFVSAGTITVKSDNDGYVEVALLRTDVMELDVAGTEAQWNIKCTEIGLDVTRVIAQSSLNLLEEMTPPAE